MTRILPKSTETSAPYWEGCRQGELRLQKCPACDRVQFYPRIMCSHCGNKELGWIVASGNGRIASFTVVRRGISEAYQTPYIVALIDLDEGPRMMSHVFDVSAEDVRIDDPVVVDFEHWSEDIAMPVFRPAPG